MKATIVHRSTWCERCGASHGLEAAHVYPRRFTTLKNDPDNLIDLCRDCHRWWHAHPMEAKQWFVEKFPKTYARLLERAGVALKTRSLVAGQ